MALPVDDFTDSDSDDDFNEDMEALKKACRIIKPDDSNKPSSKAIVSATSDDYDFDADDDETDDLELLRGIQKRFTLDMGELEEPLTMKPLSTLPPDLSDSDDDGSEDDYETLRAIQRRFAAYSEGGVKDNVEDFLYRPLQVGALINDSEKETSNRFVERTNAREGFLDCVDTSEPTCQKSAVGGRQSSDLIEWTKPVSDDVSGSSVKGWNFPKSALGFVDAIKKNRSCQKFIRSKMLHVEARVEELKKLTERVKILKDFQVACKKRTARALSQKRDARLQLISVPKLKANSKFNEEKIRASYKGPPENLHVAKYRNTMAAYPVSVSRDKWSTEERENLVKGVKQQFQGMLLQRSVDMISDVQGSYDPDNVDSVMALIKNFDITPEKMRLFLPKVNWEQLAAMYVPGRSGAECQARFLNFEDPLINHNSWTATEDKNLLHIVQQKGLSNWMDIAVSLGTNRTPFQCLARYQRSLNASILKREWTKEEDNQLRAAVELYGESNWQTVASMMEGRAGTQCSNRWIKTLHPARKRVGRWTLEEDKRLKVAVTLFDQKWKEVAKYVPGRTHPQCRERWVNSLDPSLNMSKWTDEEDLKLEAAVAEHGYCWSKVATCIPHRTDNQCWRRWKVLFPNQVPLIQAARKIRKAAFISNFVDRESERPTLCPNDFIVPETYRITGPEDADSPYNSKRKSRKRFDNDTPSSRISSEEVPMLTLGEEDANTQCNTTTSKEKGKSSDITKKDNDVIASQDSMSCDHCKVVSKSSTRKGMHKGRPRQRKKRSRDELESLDFDLTSCKDRISMKPCSEDDKSAAYEGQLPVTLPNANFQLGNVGGEPAEIKCNNGNKAKKASKLHPRRKKHRKTLTDENLHTRPVIEKYVGEENTLEIERETTVENETEHQIDAPTHQLSSSIESTPLEDVKMQEEAVRGIKSYKRKKSRNTFSSGGCEHMSFDRVINSTEVLQTKTTSGIGTSKAVDDRSSCQVGISHDQQQFNSNTDHASSGNLEDSIISFKRDNKRQRENPICLSGEEEDNITLASVLKKLRVERSCIS